MLADRDVAAYRHAEDRLWASARMSPTEHRVRLACTGTTVRVQEAGDGDPVLFIHGGPNAGSTWIPLIEHLGAARCLLVDRPGTGLSDPYPVTVANLPRIGAAFVADLLDGLGIDRAHVVASSFGGHLALRSAAASPHRFRRMVQMACPALAPGERVPPFMRLLTRKVVRRTLAALPPSPAANRLILRQLGHGKSLDTGVLAPGFADYYLALQRHTDTMRNDGDLIGQVVPSARIVGLDAGLLAKADVPTLFLWGSDDTFGGAEVARQLTATMPRACLHMIPDAGHLPWLDDPRRVAEATTAFLTAADVPS